MKLLKDKVAVVTGGTRGIGFSIVKKFLDNGAKVIMFGSKEESVNRAIAKLKDINIEYQIEGYYPNITSYSDLSQTITEIANKYGKIDILVNNAGVSAMGSIYEAEPESFDKIMALNVNAVFYGIRATAPFMKENGGGVIINTSSMVSFYGQPSGVAYPTSKFAINGLTKSLARELAKDRIRVNAVAPGVTNTDMVARLPESAIEGVKKTIPLGRVGEPDEVADAYLYLASDMASYVTGEILLVDGCART